MSNYYEILGVQSDCSEDELKKAYRKLALLWHPDKHANEDVDKQHIATETFKRIQNAYSILSDAADRSWYDRHKNDITGKDEESIGLVDIFNYFSTSVYENYTDTEQGFYTVYSSVFTRIFEEEKKYFDKEIGINITELELPPTFGISTSSSSVFLLFYSYWSSYSSHMHFCWVESFDSRDGRNRSERRFMEKENEVTRRLARRKRTDDIHSLTEFVMKRDKRYIAYQIDLLKKAEEAETKRKNAIADLQASLAKKRIENAEQMQLELERREAEISKAGSFRLADFDDDLKNRGGKRKGNTSATRTIRTSQLPTSDIESTITRKKHIDVYLQTGNNIEEEVGDEEKETNEDEEEEEEEDEEDVLEVLTCDVCHKFFKSEASMKNHLLSKKHLAAMAMHQGPHKTLDMSRVTLEESVDKDEKCQDESSTQKKNEKDDNDNDNESTPNHLEPNILSKKKSSSSSGGGGGGEVEETKKPKLNKTQLRLLRKKNEAAAATLLPGGGKGKQLGTTDTTSSELEPTGTDVKSFIRGKLSVSSVIGGSKGIPMAAVAYKETLASKLHQGLECRACKLVFDSRSELFSHVKATGHSVVKDDEDLLDAIDERGLGGGGGSGGKAAARKLKGRAKRID